MDAQVDSGPLLSVLGINRFCFDLTHIVLCFFITFHGPFPNDFFFHGCQINLHLVIFKVTIKTHTSRFRHQIN